MRTLTTTLFLLSLFSLFGGRPLQAAPDFSQPLTAIDVADYRGLEWTLTDFDDAPVVVLAFMGT